MNDIEKAESYFMEGYSCSQSVLTAFAHRFGLDEKMALKIAGGFGGGMARLGNTCGAVSGAVMVLGLKFCPTVASEQESKDQLYQYIRTYIDEFKAKHDTITCRELIGYDMNDPDEREKASESGIFEDLCPKLVRTSAEILNNMI